LPPLDAATVVPRLQSTPPLLNTPAYLFNGMINPLVPYALSGVIWFQGESSAPRAYQYRYAFPLLIEDWRQHWGNSNLPFYFCQIANVGAKPTDPGAPSSSAELREAQSMALKLPHTGQAVTIDIGEPGVHFRRKREAGERLALIALANTYGKKIPFSGPVYSSMKIEDGKIHIQFDHAEGGLVAEPLTVAYPIIPEIGATVPSTRNSPKSDLEGFAICGEDQKWVWADAKIDGNSVLVWSDQVPKPVAVRYAWADDPTCNLYNTAGLPASPFRTDDFPASTKDNRLRFP
jgi:sialate O-acetylesterase